MGHSDETTLPAPVSAQPREGRWCRSALPRRQAARWSNWLLGVTVVGFAIPVLVAALSGNLSIPHNDAWSYSRTEQIFANTGQIKLFGWASVSLIGQIVAFWPVGNSLVGQQLTVAVLGLICVYCAYDLMSASLPTAWAVFAALLITLWPGWASLSTSFMTDIPGAAATFAGLAVGRRAFQADSRRLFVFSLLIAFWALTIREQTIPLPVTLLGYGLLTHRDRRRIGVKLLISGGIIFAALAVVFLKWRASFPNSDEPHVSLAISPLIDNLQVAAPAAYFTVAAALSPAVFIRARPQLWCLRSWLLALLAAALGAHSLIDYHMLTVGNYLSPDGEYAAVMPIGRDVIPSAPWHVFLVLALISGGVMAGTLAERWHRIDPILGGFTALTAVTTLATVNWQLPFDRYLLLLAPGLLSVLLADSAPGPGESALRVGSGYVSTPSLTTGLRALAGVALAIVAVTSAALAANAFAFDAATWHAATRLVDTGVQSDRVDAGLDWVGWHSPAGAGRRLPGYGIEGSFYTRPPCVVLFPANQPARGWTRAGTFRYRTYLIAGTSSLYAFDTHAEGCRNP